MSRRDDDALFWDGDDDPTLDVGVDAPPAARVTEAKPVRLPDPDFDQPHAAEAEAPEPQPAGLGNVALVALGLLAGAYLFFAIGWFIAGLRLQALGGLPVSPTMLIAATVAAAATPVVWFIAAFTLTRRARTWVRFAWLVAGVVLLVPWPFLFTGAL